ncbi:hypothetical protein R6Q57_014150 [Mikania cordata]
MQKHHPSSQQPNHLEHLLTPITHTLTTFPDEDPGFLNSFGDIIFNEEDDSYLAASSSSTFLQLISSSIQPNFSSLNTFTPVNLSNSSSYEPQMYEYEYVEFDDKQKVQKPMVSCQEGYPTMVEQEHDKIHEEHQVFVSDNQRKKKNMQI